MALLLLLEVCLASVFLVTAVDTDEVLSVCFFDVTGLDDAPVTKRSVTLKRIFL